MSWSSARRLLARLANNWPAKALSVAIAIALVAFQGMSSISTRDMVVPLSVEMGLGLVPASELPETIRVTLRGDEDGIRAVADGEIEAFVDLSRRDSSGWHSVPVQARRRGMAAQIRPLEVALDPAEVLVMLDRRVNMVLPLLVPVQGSVESGFDLVSLDVSPSEIYVSGPLSALAELSGISTSPILIEGRSSDFVEEVVLWSPGPLVSLGWSGAAEVSATIRPAVPVRTIDGIPIALSGLGPRLVADLGGRTGSVRMEGSRELVEAFLPPPGFLFADASGVAGPGLHVVPVLANAPAGISILGQSPASLTLLVTEEPEEEPGDAYDDRSEGH